MTDLEAARAAAEKRGIGHYDRHIFLCIGPDCCTPEEWPTVPAERPLTPAGP